MDIIHIVLGKANPDRMNGVNKVVHQLASRQASGGRNVQVWGISKDLSHNFEKRNFETRLFKKQKNPFTISSELKQAIEDSNNTCFHLHGGWIPTFWAIANVLRINDKKSLLTPHGAYNKVAMKTGNWKKKIYFQLFEKQVLDTVTKIHCIGASEKQGLREIYPNSKQHILPYGFDRHTIVPCKKDKDNVFKIGFVGRIDIHTKGLDILTEAFSQFSEDKKAQLWIVGDGKEMPQLKKLLKVNNISDKSILYGSKFGEEKDALIKQMDVFTHPSRNEGLPTAVLEAASFGVPSVVTQATNVGYYVSMYKAGISIQNESTKELAAAFEKLYIEWKNNDFEKYTEFTNTMLDQEFNWAKLVEKFDEMYTI